MHVAADSGCTFRCYIMQTCDNVAVDTATWSDGDAAHVRTSLLLLCCMHGESVNRIALLGSVVGRSRYSHRHTGDVQ